jgi:Holliday junction resolvasome RuvABC endonuclease subunit|tara:strand:+ start:469 stop:1077 length:609 start_codon:yes stop_codon:yes gene_type:complete
MTKTKIIGIDYSLSSPAICVFEGLPTFDNCKIYYLTNVKKYEGDFCNGKINGRPHLPYTSQTQRHDQISDWAISVVGNTVDTIFIEGYSFGSKGLVFNLAENMGALKHKLYKLNKSFEMIVPGQVKKNATGKGNADKLKMYEQFVQDTSIDLMKEFDQSKLNNPVTDIVDSYYVAKAGYVRLCGTKTSKKSLKITKKRQKSV